MDPQSPFEWLAVAKQHETSARLLAESRVAAAQAYSHAGFAVECALKAYIMRMGRLNGWPDRDSRPELYTRFEEASRNCGNSTEHNRPDRA